MAVSSIVEGFSLTHAQILDGSTAFIDVVTNTTDANLDIYGVEEGSIEPNSDEFINVGDDVELSIWSWLTKAQISIRAGYLSFPLIASITGVDLWSSGAGDNQIFAADIWHEDSFNVAPKPMLLRMLAKDHLGAVRTLDIGVYRAQFYPLKLDGPRYKDGLKVNYDATALMSAVDELGVAFADGKKRPARLISRPPV